MAPTKVSYIINHGLATHFKQILNDGITKLDCYIMLLDESLNDTTHTCQMDILIRHWDSNDNVKVRYWKSSFLEHSTHSDLLKHFNESLPGLDLGKMFQVSMDGPAVNWKFFYALMNYHSEYELLQLINIGSSSLHTVSGALKTAVESTSWKIKQRLKSIWQTYMRVLQEGKTLKVSLESTNTHFSSVQLGGLKVNQWQTMLLRSGQISANW